MDNFLIDQHNVKILGARYVDGADLTYDSELVISNGKFTVFTYTQKVEEETGLPMHGGFIKVVVLMGATEKIVHIGSTLKHEPATTLPGDEELPDGALNTASAAYPQLTSWSTPEKVVYNPSPELYHRAWRFRGWSDVEAYMFFVDTNTGGLIDAIDIMMNADVSGHVTGFATPGLGADDASNPPVEVDLPSIIVTESGAEFAYTLDNGNYTISDVDFGMQVDVESHIESKWVKVIDFSGNDLTETAEDVSSGAVDVDFRFNCANPDVCDAPKPPEDTAQVNAFLAINKTHDWFSVLAPGAEITQQVLCEVNNTFENTCNASACHSCDPPKITSKIPTSNGNLCNSSAFTTIMAHEYGHIIQGLRAPGGLSLQESPFNEGFADTVAGLVYDTHCFAKNWLLPGHADFRPLEPCHRRLDAVAQNADFEGFTKEACNLPGEPAGCEVQLDDERCQNDHCLGLALAGAFWDLRDELLCCSDQCCSADGRSCDVPDTDCSDSVPCVGGEFCIDGTTDITLGCDESNNTDCSACDGAACIDRQTEDIVSTFVGLTSGVLDGCVIAEVLVADDDDGDLTNGTPHCSAILCAFAGPCDDCGLPETCEVPSTVCTGEGHGWGEPIVNAGVVVEWTGPAGDPTDQGPDPDFTIDTSMIPPDVTLITTVKGTPAVAVSQWRIGRVVNGHAENIGAITTAWTGTPDPQDIEVRVGVPGFTPCRNLDSIDIPAQSDLNYSSLEIVLEGSLVTSALCEPTADDPPNDPRGGLIHGQIDRSAGTITARGIGRGESGAGDLIITQVLSDLQDFETIPVGRTLQVGDFLSDVLTLTGELGGTFRFKPFAHLPTGPPVNPRTAFVPLLDIQGTGLPSAIIEIEGDLGDGSGAGGINIAGPMSGDILVQKIGGPPQPVNMLAGITIGGDMTGNIVVSGDILADITIPTDPPRGLCLTAMSVPRI